MRTIDNWIIDRCNQFSWWLYWHTGWSAVELVRTSQILICLSILLEICALIGQGRNDQAIVSVILAAIAIPFYSALIIWPTTQPSGINPNRVAPLFFVCRIVMLIVLIAHVANCVLDHADWLVMMQLGLAANVYFDSCDSPPPGHRKERRVPVGSVPEAA